VLRIEAPMTLAKFVDVFHWSVVVAPDIEEEEKTF
jgi:hypothetical protein